MAEERDRSLSRSLGKFGLIAALGIGFLIIVAWGILCSLPTPDPAILVDAEKRYEQVRTALATPAEPDLPAEAAEDTNTSPALQLKCDQLFSELLYSYDSACDETFSVGWPYSKLATAKQLAALYDTGVRVSPAAKKKFRLAYTYPIAQLAKSLAHESDNSASPTAEARIDSIVASISNALKFIHIIDCPNELIRMSDIFDPFINDNNSYGQGGAQGPLNDIPEQFNKIPLELVFPRKLPIDFNFYVALCLERARERRKYFEKTLEPGFIYQRQREKAASRGNRDVPEMVGSYIEAIVTSIVYPHIDGPQQLRTMMSREQRLQDAVAAYQAKKITLEDLVQIMSGSYEMNARLLAAELELRRGVPIPPPDKIGPESYLYDPLTKKPFKLHANKETDKTTILYLRRPSPDPAILRQYSSRYYYDSSTGSSNETTVKMIRLPATHPGLDKITSLTQTQ